MSSFRPGRGGGSGESGVSFAPMGRGDFVARVVSEFEEAHGGVPGEIHQYILDEALVPDDEWEAGLREERFDEVEVRSILLDSLEQSAQIARTAGSVQLDVASAHQGFHLVVENRGCPYPFIFC